jgi:Ser/Thr protein kinase RdoA (MazF antagonist)
MFEGGVLEHVDAQVSEAAAARLVQDVFGVAGRAERLSGERDQNFRLQADDGAAFLLKISNSAEAAAVTDLQTRALLHMAAADPTLPTPRIRPTREGAAEHAWRTPDGRTCVVRLFSFLKGAPLHQAPTSPALLSAVGQALARVDLALDGFAHPADGHDLLWDLQHAARLRQLIPAIGDPEVRRLAEAGLGVFETHAAPRLPALRAQLIHNDLNPHNVLVAEDGAPVVTGVLDMGDAVRAPLVDDVAVAAAYHVDAGDDPLAGVAALVAGYHRTLPLLDEELELLAPLILGRHAMTAAITAWRAKSHPENSAYIFRNLPASVTGLRQLLPLPPAQVAERLRTALDGARP